MTNLENLVIYTTDFSSLRQDSDVNEQINDLTGMFAEYLHFA